MPAAQQHGPDDVGQSLRGGGRARGRRRAPATIAIPTGTLIRNSERQPNVSTSTPPSAGPAAAASAPAALQAPIAAARRSGGTSASDDRQRRRDHRRGRRALQAARDQQHAPATARARTASDINVNPAHAGAQQRPPPDDVGHAARRAPATPRTRPRRSVIIQVVAPTDSAGEVACGHRRPRGWPPSCPAGPGMPRPPLRAARARSTARGRVGSVACGGLSPCRLRIKSTIVRLLYHMTRTIVLLSSPMTPPTDLETLARAEPARDDEADGRRRRGNRTRESILQAAADLASVEGLEGLTIGRLATELEMSKSGLFAHFGSKEELQLATIDAARRRFVEHVVKPSRSLPRGRERLEALTTDWLAYFRSEQFARRLLLPHRQGGVRQPPRQRRPRGRDGGRAPVPRPARRARSARRRRPATSTPPSSPSSSRSSSTRSARPPTSSTS